MLIGDDETKNGFKFLSKHGVRSLASHYLEKKRDLEDLIQAVPENLLTWFQLKDILEENKKFSEIKAKVYETIIFNKRFPKSLGLDFLKPDEEVSDDKSDTSTKNEVNFDLVKFFTDVGAPECIVKLQKQDLLDARLFFRSEIGTVEGFLELKPEGKRMRVMKKL